MSTVDNRNVLAIITADNCSACTAFKGNGLPSLKKELQTLGIVRVIEVNKKKMSDPIEPPYPIQLDLSGNWYPRFVLINGKAWNEKFSESKNSELPIEVFNGIFKDGITKLDDARKGFDKIISWISDNIDNNIKFKVSTATSATPIINKNIAETKKVYVPTCQSVLIKIPSRR